MTLPDNLLRKLQGRFSTAFSDDELNQIYADAGEVYEKAVLECYEQLVANAAKFSDYSAGATSRKKSQIFDNLLKLRDRAAFDADEHDRKKRGQVKLSSVMSVPPKRKAQPGSQGKPRGYLPYRRRDHRG